MSRPAIPGRNEEEMGCLSIGYPFHETTPKTISSGFICAQYITGVCNRVYLGYLSRGVFEASCRCSRIDVSSVRGSVSITSLTCDLINRTMCVVKRSIVRRACSVSELLQRKISIDLIK